MELTYLNLLKIEIQKKKRLIVSFFVPVYSDTFHGLLCQADCGAYNLVIHGVAVTIGVTDRIRHIAGMILFDRSM